MPTTEPCKSDVSREETAGEQSQQPVLTAYIEPGCSACRGTLEVIERVRRELPAVEIEVVDVSDEEGRRHDGVFAVPTLVLDGRIISLGIPTWSGLEPQLRDALTE